MFTIVNEAKNGNIQKPGYTDTLKISNFSRFKETHIYNTLIKIFSKHKI